LSPELSRVLGVASATPVAGGCIHRCYAVTTGGARAFVKTNSADYADAFAAEADGLEALVTAGLRAPKPIAHGTAGSEAYLLLEYLELGERGDFAALGRMLAQAHARPAPRFGWHRDNSIGATPQRNAWDDDWARFFVRNRLAMQLDLAETNGASSRLLERGRQLGEIAGALFTSYRPVPSLLHGDLWGGNWATDVSGEPVVFDPAVYFGDREADIAMTRLFGGFGPAFYAAYQAAWPLDPAAGTRRGFYNLYHVLNHFNLFGGGYGAQAEGIIERLLAELGH